MQGSAHFDHAFSWTLAACLLAACSSGEPDPGSTAGSADPAAPGGAAGAGGVAPSDLPGSGGTDSSTDEGGLSPGDVTVVPGTAGSAGAAGMNPPFTPPVIVPPSDGRCAGGLDGGRFMECLDRGVIAARSGDGAFVSWRLFGTDPPDIAFNLYRQQPGGAAQLVCTRGSNAPTSCSDVASPGASYFVRPSVGGVEGPPSGSAPLLDQDYIRIPLAAASPDAFVHLAWVGDLDADGEYEIVVDRISGQAPLVDAYSRSGAHLWRLNTGALGQNQNNIEGGPTVISNGHWDGLTVFDFDTDGSAEVAIKTANGFVFGDGTTLAHDNDVDQFVSILSGRTGTELARAPLPDDFQGDGPLQCHFGAGYFDGVRPSVVVKCKNRVGSGPFNRVAAAYDFDGSALTQRWKHAAQRGADFHQIRVLDVDADGRDELADGGYVIDDDGTLLYDLSSSGVVHGDRFHITDMDPSRPGLEGFGIQQDNPNGLETYYYDAATGEVLRSYRNANGAGADMGRGTVADLFPDRPGLEYWSFNGLFSAASGELIVAEQNSNVPWPNFAMQWDGDTGSELLDNNRVGDWDTGARARNSYSWRRSFEGLVQARGAIPFYGDIFGDWREEALLESADHSELRIYTTTFETEVRLYTLVHNPAYRNALTVHGYRQSPLVDYFMGFGMSAPPQPAIRLVNRP